MDMELLFLTVGLAALVLAAILWRRSTSPGARVPAAVARTKVTDRAVARSMLVEHADAFSTRPVSPFPVEFITGERVDLSHSISTVPHGPQWRALRHNLTGGIFHPSRLGLLTPLQRAAADGLVACLALSCRTRPGPAGCGGAAVVVVRDSLHTAVLTLLMRMCFGGGVRDVRAVQRVLRDFFDGMVDAHELASSRMARLLHWKRWQRLLGIRQRMATVLLPLIAERQRQKRSNNDGGGAAVELTPKWTALPST